MEAIETLMERYLLEMNAGGMHIHADRVNQTHDRRLLSGSERTPYSKESPLAGDVLQYYGVGSLGVVNDDQT